MSKHLLIRTCSCGTKMQVLVDHDIGHVSAKRCLLCYKGKLRHKVGFPSGHSLLIGQGKYLYSDYIDSVVCGSCLKTRRIHTFEEIIET